MILAHLPTYRRGVWLLPAVIKESYRYAVATSVDL
jgi:hypothetical protein